MNERKPRSDKGIKRGPTGAGLPPAMEHQGLVEGSREAAAHSAGRPKRVSMNNMKKLDVSEGLMEDGYYYRWFQDRDGRIAQAQSAYYEFVTDEQGNNTTRQSGPYTMQFMRLRQEYRDEDLAAKKAAVKATLETEAGIGHNEYAPDPETGRAEGGTSAIQRRVEQ